MGDETFGVTGEEVLGHAGTGPSDVSHGHPGQFEAHTRTGGDGVPLGQKQRDQSTADIAGPEDSHPNRLVARGGEALCPGLWRAALHLFTLPPAGLVSRRT